MINSTPSHYIFFHKTRYLMLILVTLCLSVILSNTLIMNFTIICMNTGSSSNQSSYSSNEKSWLFSAVAIGAIISVGPSMFSIQKYGSRRVMAFFGFFTALVTALIPSMTHWAIEWTIFGRALQGTALGIGFSVIGICTLNWATDGESAFYFAFLSCFFQIGPIFTMPISGVLCSSRYGWPSVYFLHSALTILIFAIFAIFYKENPAKHRNVSEKELAMIIENKANSSTREPVPIYEIVKTPSIWGIWITALVNFMGIQITMQFAPIYLNKVLQYPLTTTGLLSSIPQIATFVVKVVAGVLSDRLSCGGPLWSVRLFNSISIGGMGVFCLALAYSPSANPTLGLILLTICTSIVGVNCGGFFKSSQLTARQHHHFVMGVNSFLNCLSCLLAPVIVNIFVVEDTVDEWWYVWMVHGIALLIGNFVFCISAEVTPARWTKIEVKTKERHFF